MTTTQILSGSARNHLITEMGQRNNDLEPCPLSGVPFQGVSMPIVDSTKISPPFSPLRHGNDPRVVRGFTVLAAVFRGRLVRQLLATHKVCDLIRTVKVGFFL
ncbi:unnamed protein product [Echinostoma caproni]|uniref:Uncharacterized protein n=1 Tax=Echinostoma caproni TaxID=27848 RepID=A0A183B8D0_9TREM|nr:unnamed protein product [Echinostoma caproni]